MARATKLQRLDRSSEGNIVGMLTKLLLNVIALLVVEYILPGFSFADIRAAIIAAIVLGAINTFIRPIVQLIALPISIITLGITAFLINVSFLWLSAAIVPGFEIDGFLTAAIASIALSLVTAFLHRLAKD